VLVALTQSTVDDSRGNNSHLVTLDVRPGADVSVQEHPTTYFLYDGRVAQFPFTILSNGVNAPTGVTLSMSFPNTFSVVSAELQGGSCNVSGAVVSCSLGVMTTPSKFVSIAFSAPTPGLHQATFAVAADNDAVSSNNSRTINFNVRPYVDAQLVAPASTYVLVGQPVNLSLSVVNGGYVMADALVTLRYAPSIVFEAVTPAQGACTFAAQQIECRLGALAPNSTTSISMRARWTSECCGILASLSSPYDVDTGNNNPQMSFTVDEPGDVAVAVASTTASVVSGMGFFLPSITVTAGSVVEEAFIELDYDLTRALDPFSSNGPPCNWSVRPVRCPIGRMEAGQVRRVDIQFRAGSAGALPFIVRVGARNDTNPGNDSRSVTVTIDPASPQPPPPPPTSPPTNGGSGGGGGGSSDPLTLLVGLLAALALARARCRRLIPSPGLGRGPG
jgi:hypothetical protein